MANPIAQQQRRAGAGRWRPVFHLAYTLQSSALILIMHYSRVVPQAGRHRYFASTAVLLSEIAKLAISTTMALYDLSSQHPNCAATTLFGHLSSAMFGGDSWKLAVPALLFTLQNSLQYVAISNLYPSTFQITYQLKIVFTAFLGVLVLRRSMPSHKLLALFLLAFGVAIVQFPSRVVPSTLAELRRTTDIGQWGPRTLEQLRDFGSKAAKQLTKRSATYQGIAQDDGLQHPRLDPNVGLLVAVVSCASSSLATTCVERVLKENPMGQVFVGAKSSSSIWIRNAQLSFYSLFPALFIGVIFTDGADIARYGFFAGYNHWVWTIIVLQATGGILIPVVMRHTTDTITSLDAVNSIVICFLASFLGFRMEISFHYIIGLLIVLGALVLYQYELPFRAMDAAVEGHEKPGPSKPRSYYADVESLPIPSSTIRSRSRSPLHSEAFSTSSRPSSPGASVEGRFHRVASKTRLNEKRDE